MFLLEVIIQDYVLQGDLRNLSETTGVLDLGGGSTQITFVPHVGSFILKFLSYV